MNARGVDTSAAYKKSIPADVFGRFERAEAAHHNLLENAPLFIGAVIVGNMMGLPASNQSSVSLMLLELVSLWKLTVGNRVYEHDYRSILGTTGSVHVCLHQDHASEICVFKIGYLAWFAWASFQTLHQGWKCAPGSG